MRFLHTADWQIGMKAAHVGSAGSFVREERLAAAKRVIDAAREHRAEFLLVAGDTFEDNAVDRVLVQRVADILGASPCPVFLIPGNHDPLVPGSVWEHAAWSAYPHVHPIREPTPVDIPGGVLLATPILEKHSPRDPTHGLDARSESRVAIGMSHGTVQGLAQDELDYPIARDAAQRSGLDYLAIGHWHSTALYPDSSGAVRMAYSGTHETTKFGERDSGNALLVTIDGRGEVPNVSPIRTGGLTWQSLESELRAASDLVRLRESLEQITDGQRRLLDLRLRGILFPEESPELGRIRELAAARFRYARIDESQLVPPPNSEWLETLPAGLLRDVARELRDLTTPTSPRVGCEYATPAVASRALLELYRLVQEAAS